MTFVFFPTSAAVADAFGFAVRLGVLVFDLVTPPAFFPAFLVDGRRFFVDGEVEIGSITRGRALPVEPRVTAILLLLVMYVCAHLYPGRSVRPRIKEVVISPFFSSYFFLPSFGWICLFQSLGLRRASCGLAKERILLQ
jgi:hypothetical protein